jgi:hypothetical protein
MFSIGNHNPGGPGPTQFWPGDLFDQASILYVKESVPARKPETARMIFCD